MSAQFKFRETVSEARRNEIVAALAQAGFEARSLFPGQTRPRLAAIYTVPDMSKNDLAGLRAALRAYDADIEFVEAAPARSPK